MPLQPACSRRSLLKLSTTLAAGLALPGSFQAAPADKDKSGKLMAYVGTYTSPLQNMKATQVDLPPGNGRAFTSLKSIARAVR